jgi:hypothetical protein
LRILKEWTEISSTTSRYACRNRHYKPHITYIILLYHMSVGRFRNGRVKAMCQNIAYCFSHLHSNKMWGKYCRPNEKRNKDDFSMKWFKYRFETAKNHVIFIVCNLLRLFYGKIDLTALFRWDGRIDCLSRFWHPIVTDYPRSGLVFIFLIVF